jgi:hypothetical protein
MQAKNNGYLAGLIDGKGCISIFIHNSRPGRFTTNLEISIYQADERLMKWLTFHYGGRYYPDNKDGATRPSYTWFPPRGKDRELFLLSIIPYLILKKEQALLALEYLRLGPKPNPEKRAELAMRCSVLNRKKSPEAIRQTLTAIVGQERAVKIWSELYGDVQSATVETQTA